MQLIKLRSGKKSRQHFDALLERYRTQGGAVEPFLQAAQDAEISPLERVEIALELFAGWKWSNGQARRFSGLNIFDFQQLLKEREIPIHYTEEGLEEDLKTIGKISAE